MDKAIFEQLVPVTQIKQGFMSASDKVKLDAYPSNFNVALLGDVLAYWDGRNDPSLNNQAYPLASLAGSSSFINSSTGVRLTTATNGQNGSLVWNFSQVNAMYAKFRFKSWGGSGADGVWFFCYADNVPTTEFGIGLTKGYIVYFSEYYGYIGLTYGGFTDGNQNKSGGGVNPLISVVQSGINGTTTSAYNTVEVYVICNRIIIYYNNVQVINYYDVYNRDLSNTKFGFGGRTGSLNNNHDIKGLLVQKYITGMAGRTFDDII